MQQQYVTCCVHSRPRLAKFCQSKSVRNAEGEVVSTQYECMPQSSCNTAPGRAVPAAATAAPGEQSAAMRMYGDVRGRYYDLSSTSGGIETVDRKVCFYCGLGDHQRSECPNSFCRICREVVPVGAQHAHVCGMPSLSAFVEVRELTASELADVRCPLCHQVGHIDCAGISNPTKFHNTCATCTQPHHAFNCRAAPRDRWMETQTVLLQKAMDERQRRGSRQRDSRSRRGHRSGDGGAAAGKHHTDSYQRRKQSHREDDGVFQF